MNIGNYTTEFFVLNRNLSKNVIVLFPGNPGIGGAYLYFAEDLIKEYETRGEDVTIYIVSYPGHGPTWTSERRSCCWSYYPGRFTLKEQVQHKIAFMKRLWTQERFDEKSVTLIGHSIGGFMALRVLESGIFNFHRVIPLMPSIVNFENNPNASGIKNYLAACPTFTYYLAKLGTCCTPLCLVEFIIKYYEGSQQDMSEQYIRYFAKRVVTASCAENAIYLYQTEREDVLSLQETGLDRVFEEYGPKISIVWSNGDGWCPEKEMMNIEASYPNMDVRKLGLHVPHGFAFTPSARSYLAHEIREAIQGGELMRKSMLI